MYTRNVLNKILQIKNILLLIGGVFWLMGSVYVLVSVLVLEWEGINSFLSGECMGSYAIGFLSIVAILLALFSNRCIYDAKFYSGYFEGDLDGIVRIDDLARVMGRHRNTVKFQLFWFRLIYMKNYKIEKVNNNTQIILGSRKILCQCNECGAEIEKSKYFTGKCDYCGGLDIHAKILLDNKFYSVEQNINEGYGAPEYYRAQKYTVKWVIALIMCSLGLLFDMISVMGFADCMTTGIKTNDPEAVDTAFAFAAIFLGFLVLLFNGIKRLEYIHVTKTSSEYFAKRKTPFVKLTSIPYIKKRPISRRRRKVLGRVIRKNYLRNCTMEIHRGELKVVLAKRIVKNRCPYCGGAINIPIDEKCKCQYCNRVIMNVIKSK